MVTNERMEKRGGGGVLKKKREEKEECGKARMGQNTYAKRRRCKASVTVNATRIQVLLYFFLCVK
jgi:hypothetical protein